MKKIWINIICFCIGFIIGLIIKPNEEKTVYINTPVEKEIIDTLYITRDSLIYKISYLDSIKYDTVGKIYNLSDSASIELFYQLVSE